MFSSVYSLWKYCWQLLLETMYSLGGYCVNATINIIFRSFILLVSTGWDWVPCLLTRLGSAEVDIPAESHGWLLVVVWPGPTATGSCLARTHGNNWPACGSMESLAASLTCSDIEPHQMDLNHAAQSLPACFLPPYLYLAPFNRSCLGSSSVDSAQLVRSLPEIVSNSH